MSAFTDALAAATRVYDARLPEVPPGMTGDDTFLYTTWRADPWPVPRLAAFNLRVGPAPATQRDTRTLDDALAAALLALRIDLLTDDGRTWWILEFHHNVGLAQLGRLICYPELLARTFPQSPRTRQLAVTRTVNPFLLDCYTIRSIPVLVLPLDATAPHLANPTVAPDAPQRLRPRPRAPGV